MSWIDSDAIVPSFIVASFQEKWGDLPFDKLHPFSKAVRIVMDATTHLADVLDSNDEAEIAHELDPLSSRFLCNLKVLLEVEYSPHGHLLSIMPELKEQLLRLKASFTSHYGWGKSRFVTCEIDRLIKEIGDNPRFDNIYLQKDIGRYFWKFFQDLNTSPLPQPTNDERLMLTSYRQKADKVAYENFEYADSLPSRNAALLEELNARDAAAEEKRGANKHRVLYECVRIKGQKVRVPIPEWRARFAKNVHVMIRSTANLIDAIIKNDAREIDRNLKPNASPFLTDLHALLETACLPDVYAPQEMRILQSCLRRLKVAFVEHYGAANSNDVVNVIVQLIDAIYKKPQYGNKTVFEKLFGCFCRSFKSMNVSKPSESQLQTVLKSLKAIVEDACANSKDGEFLFTRTDYIQIVTKLWENQASKEYSVTTADAHFVYDLWRDIRLGIIEYAKCMTPKPTSIIKDLSNERCWLISQKFTTANELPHILDPTPLKELKRTLTLTNTPRKTIKPKRIQTSMDEKEPEDTVDITKLKKNVYRFAVSKGYRTIVDIKHVKPEFAISAYNDLPPTAASIAETLIVEATKKRKEGWCHPSANWRGAFQKGVAKRFKREQIEIQRHRDGLWYWRIIPTEEFPEHYNCKLKPRPKSF